MFSLKYKKNVLKPLLNEELTPEDVLNNISTLKNFMKDINCFPFQFYDEDIMLSDKENELKIYVLTSLDVDHKYSGKKIIPSDIDVYDDDFNKNNDGKYYYSFYSFTVFLLENHSGILKYDRKRIRYRLIYNLDQDKNLWQIDKFMNMFNKKINRSEIIKFSENYVSKIAEKLNKFNVSKSDNKKTDEIGISNDAKKSIDTTNIDNFNPPKKIDSKEIIEISNDPNIKIWKDEEYKTSDDKSSSIEDKSYIGFMYSSGNKLRLTPSAIIGDNSYRNINSLKIKVQNTLKDFMNRTDSPEEILAAELIFQEIENVSNGKGSEIMNLKDFSIDTDDIILNETLSYLTRDPNEIISPIAVLKMDNINWSMNENGESAKDAIMKIYGDKEAFNNGLISFPVTTNAQLIDSYAMITYDGLSKQLGISTKGGRDGKGADASISSLFKFLIRDDGSYIMDKNGYNNNFTNKIKNISNSGEDIQQLLEKEIKPYLTTVGKMYWEECRDTLSLLLLFGGTPTRIHGTIIDYAVKHGIGNLKFTSDYVDDFAKEASHGLTMLVMDLLDKQKYKFCQVNTKPRLKKDKFGYEISVQYPAKFSGSVTFKKAPSGEGLKFHISGK